jgi:magnesium transporter
VDHYFVVLDDISDDLEAIEEEVYFNPSDATLKRIQTAKKELIKFRRTLYPTREALLKLKGLDHPVINKTTSVFFNDVLDHINLLIDTYESQRDLVSNLMDTYMTMISNRMNEIMKVLTIISTIFIPLSFIAGVYGMNFRNMPELEWKYGYFIVLGIMFTGILGMLYYFRRRHWI